MYFENVIFLLVSQLPNKFHNKKFQYINLKETKNKTKHSLNSKIQSNGERRRKREWSKIEGKGEVDWERERPGMSGSWVRCRQCYDTISVVLQVVWSRRCFSWCWGATRPVRSRRCWGWVQWCNLGLWCDLGLCAQSRQLYSLFLLLVQFFFFFFFFFFFLNGLKVNLEIGFGPWGGKIWASRSVAKVSLDMGFRPCEECAWALFLQVWFSEIVWR